jgi:hypothetical protein
VLRLNSFIDRASLPLAAHLAMWVAASLHIITGAAAAAEANSLPHLVQLYEADRLTINRFYDLPWSTQRFERLERHLREWQEKLRGVPFEPLNQDGRIDYLLLRTRLESEQARLNLDRQRRREMEPHLPFMAPIHQLETARWRMEKLDAAKAAGVVATIPDLAKQARKEIEQARKKQAPRADTNAVPAEKKAGSPATPVSGSQAKPEASFSPATAEVPPVTTNLPSSQPGIAVLAQRTASAVSDIRGSLKTWSAFYDGFVPEFSWWMKKPGDAALASLEDYAKFLREEIAGLKGKDEDPLVGDPIGADALKEDLAAEWLAYSATELLAIGERELAWCESEMKKAAAEMGLGQDWKAALARVKGEHGAPGQQEQIVTEEARSAIDFVKSRNLVTVPALCEELWRTSMLSTDAQKTLPYAAYSGPNMLVAFARDDMKHEDKLMAMRGNNRHFTRIVTAHELIPGHHLEAFMTARHQIHRRSFRTPFFIEGWALYWEIMLWNLNYGRTPEERVGMLFWRMHRCARIIVSLRFHLGQMTPEEMVNFIVDRVGHERLGATSEVRRFIGGAYSPLYQCAYMIGGLQLKALYDELVPTGRMTAKEFNDAVLRLGAIPIELVRASLTGQPLTADSRPTWRPLVAP